MEPAEKPIDLFIESDAQGMRLDAYLSSRLESLSRSAVARLIEQGAVSINHTQALQKSEKVKEGDRVTLIVPSEPSDAPSPEDYELDIRFEDDYLGAISKQNHLICHPSSKHKTGTLSQILEAKYGKDNLGTLQGTDRLGLVHRLDGDTSGLMLFAKNDEAQASLQEQIRQRTLDRRYLALVHKNISQDTGLIDVSLTRSKSHERYISPTASADGREALTSFSTLERFYNPANDENYTLVECHLFTGRTHQIRVHMAYIDHHIVGDQMYGLGDEQKNLGLSRQFLHSWKLSFDHPVSKERIEITDGLPKDLNRIYNTLEAYSLGKTAYGKRVFSELARHIRVNKKEVAGAV